MPETRAGSAPQRRGEPGAPEILQRAQEVQEILLVALAKAVVVVDDAVRLRGRVSRVAPAPVLLDRLDEIAGAPVVEEEDPLSEAPQRRGPELVGPGPSLAHAVREPGAHPVHHQVRKEID